MNEKTKCIVYDALAKVDSVGTVKAMQWLVEQMEVRNDSLMISVIAEAAVFAIQAVSKIDGIEEEVLYKIIQSIMDVDTYEVLISAKAVE